MPSLGRVRTQAYVESGLQSEVVVGVSTFPGDADRCYFRKRNGTSNGVALRSKSVVARRECFQSFDSKLDFEA